MKELTKAEEQVMQYLWELEKGFLKDIVEQYPEPRPAYTTISTVVRVLVKKEFIGFHTYGKIHEYYPLVPKKEYFQAYVNGIVKNFFDGSMSHFVSQFTSDENMNLSELEEIRKLIEDKIEQLKKKK